MGSLVCPPDLGEGGNFESRRLNCEDGDGEGEWEFIKKQRVREGSGDQRERL